MSKSFVFNIQKFCLHDGDGIRTVIFFKGCPLSCKWCHNPEGRISNPQIAFYSERCRGCGDCSAAHRAATSESIVDEPDNPFPVLMGANVPDGCLSCGACAEACVYGAREVVGKFYMPDELVRLVGRDAEFYQASGGGVTLSGGEVMCQDLDFLVELVSGMKREGYNVAIDTCGYAPFEAFEAVLPYTDLFLYDVKIFENEHHRYFTGVNNDLILSNLRKLSDLGARIYVRIPVIEGVNAHDGEMDAIVSFLIKHVKAEKIILLPYHEIGKGKAKRFGYSDEDYGFYAPDERRMEVIAQKFRDKGFSEVSIGG